MNILVVQAFITLGGGVDPTTGEPIAVSNSVPLTKARAKQFPLMPLSYRQDIQRRGEALPKPLGKVRGQTLFRDTMRNEWLYLFYDKEQASYVWAAPAPLDDAYFRHVTERGLFEEWGLESVPTIVL